MRNYLLFGEELHAFLSLHVQLTKKESLQPLNGKHAMDAGTPTLIPTMPAFTRA
jgi:hypothetical protein